MPPGPSGASGVYSVARPGPISREMAPAPCPFRPFPRRSARPRADRPGRGPGARAAGSPRLHAGNLVAWSTPAGTSTASPRGPSCTPAADRPRRGTRPGRLSIDRRGEDLDSFTTRPELHGRPELHVGADVRGGDQGGRQHDRRACTPATWWPGRRRREPRQLHHAAGCRSTAAGTRPGRLSIDGRGQDLDRPTTRPVADRPG